MLYDNLTINEKGNLCLAGRDTVELAGKYGTPVYLLDEDLIRARMRVYKRALLENFAPGSLPFYASKALCIRAVLAIAAEEGIGIDVVSGGELYTAVSAGFPMERVCFHGSAKTAAEIEYAIDSGVGYFICDNLTELSCIDAAARRRGIKQKLLLRITPGIDPHTFAAVTTGLVDSKFGLPIATGQAEDFVKRALEKENLVLCGYQCHIGSQIFDEQPLCDTATAMAGFAADMRDKFGYVPEIIDLGGGFGVNYLPGDPVIDIESTIALVAEHFHAELKRTGLPDAAVFMEPGRSIVGDAGVTVYNVEDVKRIPGFMNYIAIDGGMTDNPRYALYRAKHEVLIANKAALPPAEEYTIAGRCCESDDMIREKVPLPVAEPGDTLAVLTTGAYNYSMASHYNCVPRPPVVMLRGGKDYVAVRRETYEDLLACQLDNADA